MDERRRRAERDDPEWAKVERHRSGLCIHCGQRNSQAHSSFPHMRPCCCGPCWMPRAYTADGTYWDFVCKDCPNREETPEG